MAKFFLYLILPLGLMGLLWNEFKDPKVNELKIEDASLSQICHAVPQANFGGWAKQINNSFSALRSYSLSIKKVQSPEQYEKINESEFALFLAGSVSYPWREELAQMIDSDYVVLLIPINDHAHLNNKDFRISWEHEHMKKADALLFWFPKGEANNSRTFSMTSLFELGRAIESMDQPLIVGIDPEYPLREELLLQLKLLRPDIKVYGSLEDIAKSLNLN